MIVDFIQKIVPMSQQEVEAFVLKANRRVFKENELFARKGEVCKELIYIEKGIFRYFLYHQDKDITKDFAIDTQNPFCTSFTSFMTGEPSQIGIEAILDSSVLVWKAADVLPLFEKNHAWTLFAKRIIERLYFRKERRELLFLKNSPLQNYQQFLKDFPGINQRIPQYLIASYLGVTPESLSRIRKRLTAKS